MAEGFDALRFSGPIGRLIADTQEQQIAAFLAPLTGRRILDVGTGTGRAAIALARRGAVVTGVDASAEMLDVARRRAGEGGLTADQAAHLTFVRGDAHQLDFPDRAFDAVVCLRVLMHTPDWRRSLAQLCRVASDLVVIDYPARASGAAIESAFRHLAARFNPRIEAYRVFSRRQIAAALAREGFRIIAEHRQFVLPIALHKRIGSLAWTTAIEGALARGGVTHLVGSPVTLVAARCAS